MEVEFGVEVGEYRGVVRVSRRVFQRLLGKRRRRNGVSKSTTFTGPGWNSLSSARSAGGN
jgi:hypothetical protein